ncbi:hypothetical protein [Pajaroellobacter abortibovis]|uniref:Uncharacterized protein n=1 Tax=Pajaroellobacter abortibovis TaxID=1882918 RepID=A0A1L6MZE9_9BACT|nr:hypothetical protein [Pajaroellobacter abortibovis]APS00777.1 hypothetical protein BCY86_08875 [Pajaroellobacter abortibovis]
MTVEHQVLEPIFPVLGELPRASNLPPPEPPKPSVESPYTPPAKWEADVAMRELWTGLLPYFS